MDVCVQRLISKWRYQSCKDIFEAMLDKDIPYAVIKGEPLSMLAYGCSGQRTSADIDILVPKEYIRIVHRLFLASGFQSKQLTRKDEIMVLSASHQFPPLRKAYGFGSIEVDLNFDIFWGEYTGKRISITEFLSDSIQMNLFGINVKTLDPLKAMVALILHHYKEMNSIYHLATHNSISKNMFKDVYYLWKNNQDSISIHKLDAIATEYGITTYVFYILYFTNLVYRDNELRGYVDVFHSAEGEKLLECYGLTSSERKRWNVDFEERLITEDLYALIGKDLTKDDRKKIERSRRIFS